GVRPGPHRGAGPLRGSRGDHVRGLAWRTVRASRTVLGPEGADAAAASLYAAASLRDPLCLQRRGDAAHRAPGPAVHDERAVERSDARPHGALSPHAAEARAR